MLVDIFVFFSYNFVVKICQVSMVLDGIILMYGSLDDAEKEVASQDVSKLIRQTISTLRFEITSVIVNSLKLLEALATDHAKEFISDLGAIFPRIQRYMDDAKVAIRHHALKVGGALVVRLPFDIVGRFIFACIEYKPSHPEISLKLAALSLLSISPSYSMSSNPLLSRIILIAGDYIDNSENSFDSPRGNAAVDVAKDTISLALMTLCFSSQHVQQNSSLPAGNFKNVEDMLPVKLSTILGIPPQSPLSIELCRRAKCSDFPSLRQDSYLSGLATIAMEASLVSQNSGLNIASGIIHSSPDGKSIDRAKPNISIKIPEFAVTPIKSKNFPSSLDSLAVDSSARHMNFAPVNVNGVSVLHGNDDEMSSAPTMESYQPSWTPKEMGKSIDGNSPWAHSSQLIPGSPITTPLDRSKLTSIKKGRKPGSRLRARTADEALVQDDSSMSIELSKMPATAGNDPVGRLTGVESTKNASGGGALTPVEVGFYSNDGTRSNRIEQQQQQIQKIKITGRRGSRLSKNPQQELANSEHDFFSAKGFRKMETLEFSSDSDSERGSEPRFNIAQPSKLSTKLDKVVDEDPFGTRGGSLCHSDDEIDGVRNANEGDVKTFPANRPRNVPSLDLEGGFSIQGSSYQRQNSSGSQISDGKSQSNGDERGSGGGTKLVNNNSGGSVVKASGVKRSALKSNSGATNTTLRQSSVNGQKLTSTGSSTVTGDATASGKGNEHISVVVNPGEQPSGQDVFDYLERDQLEPCAKPSRDIAKAVKELTTADWPDIFHLLNTTRRLFVHHGPEVISSGQLHAIVLGLIKQAHNLRSAVAKNSILAIEDMFMGLRQKADGEVTAVTAALIKRCADSSVFITDTIDDCVVTMIRNTNVSRSLMALLTGLDNRNQVIRGKVSNYLVELVLSMSNEMQGLTKELDSFILKLSKMIQDSSPEARMNSREIIRLMITNGMTTRKHLESMLTPDIVEKSMAPQPSPKVSTLNSPMNRVKRTFGTTRGRNSPTASIKRNTSYGTQSYDSGDSDVYTPTNRSASPMNMFGKSQTEVESDNLCVAGVSPRGNGKLNDDDPPLAKGIASRRRVNNGATPKASTKKISQNSQDCFPELVDLPNLLLVSTTFPDLLIFAQNIFRIILNLMQNLTNKNWQERRDALTHLTDHLLQHYDILDSAGKVPHCVERILDIFEDGSVKVCKFKLQLHISSKHITPHNC